METLTITCPTCGLQRSRPYGKERAEELKALRLTANCPSCAGKQGGRKRKALWLECLMPGCADLQLAFDGNETYRCERCGMTVKHPRGLP